MVTDNGWLVMAPSHCTDLSQEDQSLLLQLARQAIVAELSRASPEALLIDAGKLALRRGVFVTLTKAGSLRGCIGTLESDQPLHESVPDCARGAAFRDPRFPSVSEIELEGLRVEISVLTNPQPIRHSGRDDLLRQLRPGTDGLLIEQDNYRATFLPQVWEQLSRGEEFLSQLMKKAGLPGDYWSEQLRCSRYQCIKFSEAETDQPPA